MKVFVTGGTGFIGKYLVQRLAERGDDVICLTRDLNRISLPTYNNVEFVEGDILKPETYKKFLANVDVVYYLAAFVDHDPSKKNLVYNINVNALKQFLFLAKKYKVPKIIYLSSAGIFHSSKDSIPNEDANYPDKFINYYCYTKYLGHLEVQKYIKDGLNIVSILPVSVYGPGSPLFYELIDFLYKKRMFLKGLLGNKLSFVYIDDVISGILLIEKAAPRGESYIVSGEALSMAQFIKEVEKYFKIKIRIVSMSQWLIVSWLTVVDFCGKILKKKFYPNMELYNFLRGNLVASDKKISDQLGYKNSDLKTGLKKMFDSYKEFNI